MVTQPGLPTTSSDRWPAVDRPGPEDLDDDAIVGSPSPPDAGGDELHELAWWRGLSARVVVFLVIVLLGSVASAWLMVDLQRRLQERLELLTLVYVPFQDRFADAFARETLLRNYLRQYFDNQVEAQLERKSLVGPIAVPRARRDTGDDSTATHSSISSEPRSSEREDHRTRRDPLIDRAMEERRQLLTEARLPLEQAVTFPEALGGVQRLQGVNELLSALRDLDAMVLEDADAHRAAGESDSGWTPELRDAAIRRLGRIQQAFRSIKTQASDANREYAHEIREAGRRAERWTLAVTVAAALLALIVAAAVVWTLRPLHRLIQRVRKLGRGDWSQRIDVGVGQRPERDNEVSRLAREFNWMAEALDERERRLIHGERMAAVGRMAAQITHEIRNPLASVGLNVELLEDELAPDNEEGRELLRRIGEEVDRLAVITESYLSYARRPRALPSLVDLRAVIDDLLDFLAREHARGEVQVVREYAAEPVWVRGDPRLLRQAFLNLLRNAQEAALEVPSGDDAVRSATIEPQISVSLECKAGTVVAIVGDTGPGIEGDDPERLERIFEPFVTGKARGTGLGLPVVSQVIAEHAGSVKVLSTGPQGTRFELRLPACDPHDPSVSSDTAQWGAGVQTRG